MRAIEMYDTGLQRYPSSFDLAYNKYVTILLWIYTSVCEHLVLDN